MEAGVKLMPYYDEYKMESLRLFFEEEILKWKDIEQKKMFGCPCVKVNGKLFAFLVTDGIVLTKLNDVEKSEIIESFKAGPFKTHNRTMRKWVQIPYRKNLDLESILPYIRLSYENAKSEE
jgi:hypothetical protein